MTLIHNNPWLIEQLLKAAQETAPPAATPAPTNQQVGPALQALLTNLESQIDPSKSGLQHGVGGNVDMSSSHLESMGSFIEWLASNQTALNGKVLVYRADQHPNSPGDEYGYYKIEPGTQAAVAVEGDRVRPTRSDRTEVRYWINTDLLKQQLVNMQSDPSLKSNTTYQWQLLGLVRDANSQFMMDIGEQYKEEAAGDQDVVDSVPNPIDSEQWGAQGAEKLTYGDIKSGNALGGWIKAHNIGVKKGDKVYHINDLQYFKICDVIAVLSQRAHAMTAVDAGTQKLVAAYQSATAALAKQYNCSGSVSGSGSDQTGGGAAPGSQAFLEQLVTVLPFDPNTIDFDKITTFTDMYAAWVGSKKPNVAQLKDRVHRAIMNANALLSVPSPIQIGGISTEAFKMKSKDPYYAKKLAIALADVITSAGSLYQDFANTFEQSYGKAAAQTLQQQVYPGGPQYNNMQILNRLISSLPG